MKPTKKQWQEIRKAVIEREHNICQGCYRFILDGHLHHIKSRGAGGKHTPDNLMWLCHECHNAIHTKGRESWKK